MALFAAAAVIDPSLMGAFAFIRPRTSIASARLAAVPALTVMVASGAALLAGPGLKGTASLTLGLGVAAPGRPTVYL